MSPMQQILVPVDFSEHSAAAVERAFSLAAESDAEVLLLHAMNLPPLAEAPSIPADLRKELERDEREAFERYCGDLRDRGLSFTSRLDERDASVAIREAARADEIQSIIMGSHGRRGLDRFLLGSVAERTLHGAPVPVHVVRESPEQAKEPIRSILLATDFSAGAAQVEDLVIEWARRFSAEVEIFHVIRETAVLFAPYAVAGSSDFEGQMREAANHRIERVADRFRAAGVSVKSKIVYGRASEAILDRAEATGVQLIAMGSRGYSALARIVLGSVAQKVLRHAPCGVLVAGEPERSQTIADAPQ